MGLNLYRSFILSGLVVGALFIGGPATACPILLKAEPRVGSSVSGPLNEVVLHFTGKIHPDKSALTVKDKQGRDMTTGKPVGQGKPIDSISVPVKITEKGKYKVTWRIHCDCGEGEDSIIPGDYSFNVK